MHDGTRQKTQSTLSVILANYNHGHFLSQSLQSLVDQSYQPAEIIIVDDGSTDNSVEIIQDFARRYDVIRVLQNHRNQGVIYSQKRALEVAVGEYVHLPAADDFYSPELYERLMKLATCYPRAGVYSALFFEVDEKGENQKLFLSPIISRREQFVPPELVPNMLNKYGNWILNLVCVIRRDVLQSAIEELGERILELRSFYDGFLVQLIALRYGACFIPEPLGMWRRMESSDSSMTQADPEIAEQTVRRVEQLMRTTYRALFPQDYVDNWKKVQFYWQGDALLRRLQAQQKIFLKDLRRMRQNRNFLDKFFCVLLQLTMHGQFLAAQCYFMTRGFTWPAARAVWNSLIYRFTAYRKYKNRGAKR